MNTRPLPTRRALLATLALGAVAPRCALATPPFDLARLVDDALRVVLLPAYAATSAALSTLSEACDALCEGPTLERLEASRDAWRAARLAVRRALLVRSGPWMSTGFEGAVDYRPFSEAAFERALAAMPAGVSEAYVDTVGSNAKGLAALERVLFAQPDDARAVLASLGAAGAPSARCRYGASVARFARTSARNAEAAWGPYASELRTAGRGSALFATQGSAMHLLLNELARAIDFVRYDGLALPLGEMHGGAPQPALALAPVSEHTLRELRAALRAADDLYRCRDERESSPAGLSLSERVRTLNAPLDARVLAALTAGHAALEALAEPLATALTERVAQVEDAMASLRALQVLLTADVFSLLGVPQSFSERDGD